VADPPDGGELRPHVLHLLRQRLSEELHVRKKDDGIKRKTPETRPNQKESLPNFAQVISMELVRYPKRVMSQFELKLREFHITSKNVVFLTKTKLVRFFVLVLIQSNSLME